jgi:hypothetical protein
MASDLNVRGFKVRVVWMRGTHLLARSLAGFFSRFDSFKGLDNPFFNITIPTSLRRVWQLIEFISFLPIFFLRYTIPRAFGYFVIADRFLIDFVVWITLTTNSPEYSEKFEARFLLALNRKISSNFYVFAEEYELLKRKNDMPLKFLIEQKNLYSKLSNRIDAQKLDTTFIMPKQASMLLLKTIL